MRKRFYLSARMACATVNLHVFNDVSHSSWERARQEMYAIKIEFNSALITVYCAMHQLGLMDYKYLFKQSRVSGIC